MDALTLAGSDRIRAQNFTLDACRARAADVNTAADHLCRALLLCKGFASEAEIHDVFGSAIDMLSNAAGQIAKDMDDERLAHDLVTVDLSELRAAFDAPVIARAA